MLANCYDEKTEHLKNDPLMKLLVRKHRAHNTPLYIPEEDICMGNERIIADCLWKLTDTFLFLLSSVILRNIVFKMIILN